MQYVFRSKPRLLAGEKGGSGVMAQGFPVETIAYPGAQINLWLMRVRARCDTVLLQI